MYEVSISGKQTYKGYNHDLDMMVTWKTFTNPIVYYVKDTNAEALFIVQSGFLKAMVKERISYTMQGDGNVDSTLLTFTETKSCRLACWK